MVRTHRVLQKVLALALRQQEMFALKRLLVVEDEITLRRSLCRGLREEGYQVLQAENLAEALRVTMEEGPDAILLDRMLADGDGLDLVRQLRNAGNSTPILILTAKDNIQDRIHGLDGGADDYLVKPFVFHELLARIRAILRRAGPRAETSLRVDDLELNLVDRTFTRGGQTHELSQRQFELLQCLMRHPHEVVSRETLADEVWKQDTATWTNVIEVHINQLRKRIEQPGLPAILRTIRGQGYRLGIQR